MENSVLSRGQFFLFDLWIQCSPTNHPPILGIYPKELKKYAHTKTCLQLFGGGLVPQSCLTLCNPVDCSPSGSSVHEIFQARVLKWVTISFSRGSSQPTSLVSLALAGRFFSDWARREAAAVFVIAKTWKQPRYPLVDEWISKLWYILSMKYYSELKETSNQAKQRHGGNLNGYYE